jgi:hypothetical protein
MKRKVNIIRSSARMVPMIRIDEGHRTSEVIGVGNWPPLAGKLKFRIVYDLPSLKGVFSSSQQIFWEIENSSPYSFSGIRMLKDNGAYSQLHLIPCPTYSSTISQSAKYNVQFGKAQSPGHHSATQRCLSAFEAFSQSRLCCIL